MPIPPAGAADSISNPWMLFAGDSFVPVCRASTASSSTAGTEWSRAEPCEGWDDSLEDLCESVWLGV